MNPDQLLEWKTKLVFEIEKLKAEADDIASQMQKKVHQVDLVDKLIASHSDPPQRVVLEERKLHAKEIVTSGSPIATATEVKDHVYEILKDANRPMNINEIHAEFLRRGYAIPGKGTPFNILVHVNREVKGSKSNRFVWVGRGTYAIKETNSNKKSAKKSSGA